MICSAETRLSMSLALRLKTRQRVLGSIGIVTTSLRERRDRRPVTASTSPKRSTSSVRTSDQESSISGRSVNLSMMDGIYNNYTTQALSSPIDYQVDDKFDSDRTNFKAQFAKERDNTANKTRLSISTMMNMTNISTSTFMCSRQRTQRPGLLNVACTPPLSFSQFSSTAGNQVEEGEEQRGKSNVVQWKQVVKPFLMKCHPDMAKQYGLSNSAQRLNLRAIQNLNSYVDGIITMQGNDAGTLASTTTSTTKIRYPFDRQESHVEIDFVLALEEPISGVVKPNKSRNKGTHPTTSRRVVELKLPPPHATPRDVQRLAARQISKLLQIAGLPISSSLVWLGNQQDKYVTDDDGPNFDNDDFFGENVGVSQHRQGRRRHKTLWERSRDAFTANIDWKRFDELYEEAHRDMDADYATYGLIRNNPRRRRAMLATILKGVQVVVDSKGSGNAQDPSNPDTEDENTKSKSTASKKPNISPLDRLVTLRRLYHILDDNFDRLQLEECGRFWETVTIELHGPREYSSSSSSLHKRRARKLDTGFGYTIHEDNTMTVKIPIDFREQELIEELDRNVWDFYNLMQKHSGLESIFR